MNGEPNPTDVARGHWRYILTQFDVPEGALTGRHTSCPVCGGEDRFRFDNKEGAGTYYCSGCGAGTGYSLLMKLRGWDFPTALKEVKDIVKPDLPVDMPPAAPSLADKKASLNRLWKSGRTGTQEVIDYLSGRGISPEIADEAAQRMRFSDKVWHRERAQYLPAILAPVVGHDGRPVSIHRTYLIPGGKERKMMPPAGKLTGAGIWFGPRKCKSLLVAEGIETTLAAMQYFSDVETGVSAVNANGLESFSPPNSVTDLFIIADNDASFTGQKAAFLLAHKVALQKRCNVTVVMPTMVGEDMLDVVERGTSVRLFPQRNIE